MWLAPFDWERLAIAFVVCTVVLALLYGAAIAFQITYALRGFGAEARALGLVAVSALYTQGAPVVVTATMLALAITGHRQSIPSGLRVAMIQLWPVLVAVPIAAPVVVCLMIGAAFAVAYWPFGVPFHTSWESIVSFVVPSDALWGLLSASISGPLLMVAVPFFIRITFAKPRRLRIIIAAAFVTSFAVNTLADIMWEAVFKGFHPPDPAVGALMRALDALQH